VKVNKTTLVITIAVVSISLALAAIAAWHNAGIGVGSQDTGGPWHRAMAPVLCAVAAVGVIFLAFQAMSLAAGIASIAAWLDKPDDAPIGKAASKLVRRIAKKVEQQCGGCTSDSEQLEEKVREVQIQLQLAKRRERNTEAIIYSICDAVVVVDDADRILMANKAAEEVLGFDLENSRRSRIEDLVSDDRKQFVEFFTHCRNSKARATRQEIVFTDDEEVRTFDCIVSCVYDERDRVCGAVAVLHDVTREKEISKAKNDFVSHVSHELKTPLASITAYSEMLADGEASDEETQKEFYEIIQTQAKRLNGLIEDILNISRIESGLIKVNKEPVSLTILIKEQLHMIQSFAREKNIDVTAPNPIVFDQVNGDKSMIQQVIVNLLSNAVKYTKPGGSVSIESQVDDNAGTVMVSIIDTGVGIPPDDLPHVFDKFFRVGANNAVAKGTGLGLNLVKQIVEKVHDGRVFVESVQGHGSTFGFELPLARSAAAVTA
jgi:two-component system phosphate regulon sensor histidine kinase PhoR